jgi:hypothetical protein
MDSIEPAFAAAIRAAFARKASPDELYAIVVEHKGRGLTQPAAYTALEQLRREAPDEATEDPIIDLMDYVVGWCSPQARIWPDYYKP